MAGKHLERRIKVNKKEILATVVILVVIGIGFFLFVNYFRHSGAKFSSAHSSSASSEEVESSSTSASTSESASSESTTQANSTVESTAEPVQTVQLDTSALTANSGIVSYGVYYFNSGKELSSNNSAKMISASVIKVYIMEYIYLQASKNALSLDEQVQGVPISSLVNTMIQQSDNNATNTLIDYVGMDVLNNFFAESGYTDTELQRRMLDDAARSQGLDNYTSLNDTMNFLKKLYQHKDQYPYSKMLEIMEGQQVSTKIRNKIPQGTLIANKTGELGDVENDIGIVLTDKDPFAIVVLTNGVTAVGNIRNAIADFAYEAYELGV